MKGAAQGQWMAGGVCAMRGPQTQTQHNTQLCRPPQLGWNVTCFRLGPVCVCVKYKWKEEDMDEGMSATEHAHSLSKGSRGSHEPFDTL